MQQALSRPCAFGWTPGRRQEGCAGVLQMHDCICRQTTVCAWAMQGTPCLADDSAGPQQLPVYCSQSRLHRKTVIAMRPGKGCHRGRRSGNAWGCKMDTCPWHPFPSGKKGTPAAACQPNIDPSLHPGVGTQHGRRAQLCSSLSPSISSLCCVDCVALQCVLDDASLAHEVRSLVAQGVVQQSTAPVPMDDPLLEELLDLNDDIPVSLSVFLSFDQCDSPVSGLLEGVAVLTRPASAGVAAGAPAWAHSAGPPVAPPPPRRYSHRALHPRPGPPHTSSRRSSTVLPPSCPSSSRPRRRSQHRPSPRRRRPRPRRSRSRA